YGNTVDFADFREYNPGDDFRRIDYHVLARLDQVLIKLYEADDEVTIRFLLDTSDSMGSEGKLDHAKRIAAALGFIALSSHDSVTVHTFPEHGTSPRFAGRAGIPALFSYLESLEAEGTTPFARAAGHLLSRAGPPGITIVISDLLTPEWPALIGLRSAGSDLTIMHLLAEGDISPDLAGDLMLVDREDGERLTVSVTEDILKTFSNRVSDWKEEIRSKTLGVGGAYITLTPDSDIEDLIIGSWRETGVLR
ncbi:MAG TPA: DUF58 domain-containing protein, partial [Acidimicrobiia bacterium]